MATPIAILLSGRGSNFLAIERGISSGEIPATIELVVSNVTDASGLERAKSLGLNTIALPHQQMASRQAHDAAVLGALEVAQVEWVCLAGYMRMLSPLFVRAFPNRILNIHPSLLPAFPGLHAQRQALAYGVRYSGCTVHMVDEELDHGPIVLQRVVEVQAGDNEESLSERILVQEHQVYPEALRRLLSEDWKIDERRIEFN